MTVVIIALIVLLVIFFAAMWGFYSFAFSYPAAKRQKPYELPEESAIHASDAKTVRKVMDEMRTLPYEEVSIRSREGYTLCGRYYDLYPGRPLEIFFHGYHGTPIWDSYGCFRFCRNHQHNILIIEERSHGTSEVKTVTLGIKERYDCLAWADYAAERVGKDTDIILSGVSMGAAIVMMASELPLPSNVKAIIADCGFTSPAAVMKSLAAGMHLPVNIGYFFSKLGARLFGGFDLEESSAIEAVKKTSIPIMFIHGTKDQVVPFPMCGELFDACASRKKKLVVPDSEHALNAIKDYETYEREVEDFLRELHIKTLP